MTLKAAIIGTGGIARAHVHAIRSNAPRVDLVAAADIDAARAAAFCQEHGIPASYADAGELLERERPDLVHICTPPSTHRDLILQSLEAGVWVLCEKPLCASLAEMDEIEEAEQRTGNFCSSVFQWRFGSAGQHLKQLIAQEALGRPLVGVCHTLWYRDEAYYAVPWRGKWSTELGGVSMGHGIHAMDFFLWLLGDWEEITANAGTLYHKIEVEDVSMALLRMKNGAMASIVNSVLSPRQESYIRLDFERATVELRHLYHYTNDNWTFTPVPGPDSEKLQAAWAANPTDIGSSHAAQLSAMLDAMERGERPPVSGPDVRRTIEFLASLYKAAFTGARVSQGSITPDDPFYHHMAGPFVKAGQNTA